MTSQIIACRQGANNSIQLGDLNNSWTNVFKQPITLEKGSTIRVNYVFLNTNAKSDLIKIVEGINNVFKIKINYYYHRSLWDVESTETGPNVLAPIYLSDETGDNIYDNIVEYTIPTGFYTVDQISERLNALMIASEPRTLYIAKNGAISSDPNDGNWRIVTFESDFFKSFYSATGYSLNNITNAGNQAEWPGLIYDDSYMCQTGANTPVFIYSPQQSRFTFQNMHTRLLRG